MLHSLHPKLHPFYQLVENSPNYINVEILDYTCFGFTQKKPWGCNEHHPPDEKLVYTCGLDWDPTISFTGPPPLPIPYVYVTCHNTGDEEHPQGMMDFINYIQPTHLRNHGKENHHHQSC